MNIPFVGSAYNDTAAKSLSAQTCINWFVEIAAPGSKSLVALKPTPGSVEFCDLGTGAPVIAMCSQGDYAYAVSDRHLFKIAMGGGVTDLGAMTLGAGTVSMASNGNQVVIANRKGGWLYSELLGLIKITDPDFPGADDLCYFDGYFVFIEPNTGRHFICALKDGTAYDALDYATAEASPDNLVAVLNDHRELWLMGQTGIEVWYNSGNSGYPFDRLSGAFIELGCISKHSPAKIDNTVFWLASDLTVRRASGYSPVKISTLAMDKEIAGYTQHNNAVGYTYSQDGHSFYVLTFPSDNATWCYDSETGAWHQRSTLGMGRHRGNCYLSFAGRHLIGDALNGRIYYLDTDADTDAGLDIVRERTTQVLSGGGKKLFMPSLEILFDNPGDGKAAMLQWSKDAGRSWSEEMWKPLGYIGEYNRRAIWRRLGSFDDRIFRLRTTSRTAVLGANAEIISGI